MMHHYVAEQIKCSTFRKGYIPLSLTNTGYVEEKGREINMSMPQCNCSNCGPSGSINLIRHMQDHTNINFDSLILDRGPPQKNPPESFPEVQKACVESNQVVPLSCTAKDSIRSQYAMINLTERLNHSFASFNNQFYRGRPPILSEYLFPPEHANQLIDCLQQWKKGDVFMAYTNLCEDEQIRKDQEELDEIEMKKEHQKKKELAHERSMKLAEAKLETARKRQLKRLQKHTREDDARFKKQSDADMLAIYKKEAMD